MTALTSFTLHRVRAHTESARLAALPGAGEERVDRLLTLLWDARQLAQELVEAAAPTGTLNARVR